MNQQQLGALACSIAELLSTLNQECCAGRLSMEVISAPLEILYRSDIHDHQLSLQRLTWRPLCVTQATQRDLRFDTEGHHS